jgi:hypothetical protein
MELGLGRLVTASGLLLFVAGLIGCADETAEEDLEEASQEVTGVSRSEDGIAYFHGMDHLGLSARAIRESAPSTDVLAPRLSNAALQGEPSTTTRAFLRGRRRGVVGGYSLGRVPVLRLMAENTPGLTRAIILDPTFDSASGLGKGTGGAIARRWLEGDEGRSLLLVYGDATIGLGGERSYVAALDKHPRADLCRVRGDHPRFMRSDMAYALVATDCFDLKRQLGSARDGE